MGAPGLPEDRRPRCRACGNLTRFDVETTERVRRYWHADLSGAGTVEEEERSEVRVETIACRWCGSRDAIEFVDAPATQTPAAQVPDAAAGVAPDRAGAAAGLAPDRAGGPPDRGA